MILVVAGLHERPFDRLIHAIAPLAGTEELVVQRGASRVEVPGASTFESIASDRLAAAYARARVVIGQASPGVLFDALDAGKRPILVPRRSSFGEHVDDHQVAFAEFVRDRAVIVEDTREIEALVRSWDRGVPEQPPCGVRAHVVARVGQEVESVVRPTPSWWRFR